MVSFIFCSKANIHITKANQQITENIKNQPGRSFPFQQELQVPFAYPLHGEARLELEAYPVKIVEVLDHLSSFTNIRKAETETTKQK